MSLPADLAARADALRRDLGIPVGRAVIVAISTGPEEEAALLEAMPKNAELVVVPRKPERFEEVARLADWVRRSEHLEGHEPRPVGPGPFLIDTMGEAEVATALADLVVVGRTFDGLGGSNPIPAAALGKPIVSGPDHHNFAEVTEALAPAIRLLDASGASAAPGARAPDRAPSLAEGLADLLADADALARMARAGPEIVANQRGATDRNAALVLRMLTRHTLR